MSARLRLPRVLADIANVDRYVQVDGSSVETVLASLFASHPGLRNHIISESGAVRDHVSVFVDGRQAGLASEVVEGSEIVVLQAVSGG